MVTKKSKVYVAMVGLNIGDKRYEAGDEVTDPLELAHPFRAHVRQRRFHPRRHELE